eukprot:gene8811-761_t
MRGFTIFCFIVIALGITDAVSTVPGIKIGFTNPTFNLVQRKFMNDLQNVATGLQLPNFSSSKFIVEEIFIRRIAISSSTSFVPSDKFRVHIQKCDSMLTIRWKVKTGWWWNVGRAEIYSNFDGNMLMQVANQGGKALVKALSSSLFLRSFRVKITRGGAGGVTQLIMNSFRSSIHTNLQNTINNESIKIINNNANKFFLGIPYDVKLYNNIHLDYLMTQQPIVNSGYTLFQFKGECFNSQNRKPTRFLPKPMPNIMDTNVGLTVLVSEFPLLTAAEQMHEQNLLKTKIDNSMMPNPGKILNTAHPFMKLTAPGLFSKYPNKEMLITLKTLETPNIEIFSKNITVNLKGEMDFFVKQDNLVHVISSNTTITCSGTVKIENERIILQLIYLSKYMKLIRSNVGNIDFKFLNDSLNNYIFPFAIIEINKVLLKGFNLPVMPEVKLIEPTINKKDGYLIIQSNVRFQF